MSGFWSAGIVGGGAIPDSGIARYTFDDADTESGSALDIWGGNNGTIQGATTGVAGINPNDSGEAYDFGGDSDRVDIPDLTAGLDAATFAIWINVDSKGPFERIIGCGNNNFRAFHEDGGGWTFGVNGTDLSQSSDTLSTGTNVLIGIAYDKTGFGDGNTARIYKNDGTILASGSPSSSAIGSGAKAIMSKPNGADGTDGTDGVGDDPRFYSKALTQTEFLNLYNSGSI